MGYMARKKQAGFLFTKAILENQQENPFTHTLAHELGHGAFRLEHTFSEYASLSKGATDNLMDYGTGTRLNKYQWDYIHDPVAVLGLFEEDEESALTTTNLTGMTALVNSDTLKADTIFVITNNTFKLDAKRNVANGGEVKFRLTIKPEGGGADVLHPAEDWKTVQNNESWVLDLTSLQEGKYILSFKVGETTNTVEFYVRTAAHDYACSICGRDLKLSDNTFASIFPQRSDIIKNDPNSVNHINEALKKGGFTTCHRQAHFLSQVYAESGGLKASIEGGGYTVQRMLEIYRGNSNTKDVFFKQSFWDDKVYLDYATISLYETASTQDALNSRYKANTFETFKWKSSSVSDTVKIPTQFTKKDSADYKKPILTDAQILQNKQNLSLLSD